MVNELPKRTVVVGVVDKLGDVLNFWYCTVPDLFLKKNFEEGSLGPLMGHEPRQPHTKRLWASKALGPWFFTVLQCLGIGPMGQPIFFIFVWLPMLEICADQFWPSDSLPLLLSCIINRELDRNNWNWNNWNRKNMFLIRFQKVWNWNNQKNLDPTLV